MAMLLITIIMITKKAMTGHDGVLTETRIPTMSVPFSLTDVEKDLPGSGASTSDEEYVCEKCEENVEWLEECRGPGHAGTFPTFCEDCLQGCYACGLSVCPHADCSYVCAGCRMLFCQRPDCCPALICDVCETSDLCECCFDIGDHGCIDDG